ncbi:hypothetical protein G6F57_001796 [Rhizopus arrhizus]|uniref:Wax synthase domain-containing protein n=1 Tax=Rhizopus oryzae TaxID=64495 RepID=A0A9P6X6B1_RHIOR|nr:hypothetical protein G6F23_008592 [Rhizopus arrhizus]KAG1423894.1 hypothetical protein G6F58_002633 [Rhizopus delemar]KAG0766156.1 hypothetical protein G6F24_003833 [Rhizopus arrhizus]KAG0792366.1 hypothetical protein G6F22_005882 [Rhizopus arrhizus]KAG0795394.1 hypothetical protein G6F21_002141 [Rhizopus arrhizus]
MSEDYAQSPFINASLPPAIVLPYTSLTLLYAISIGFELFLLKNEKRLPVTSAQLRVFIVLFRIALPLVFVSPNIPINVLFAAVPWFFTSYTARMPIEQLTLAEWTNKVIKITSESSENMSVSSIRYRGAANCCLGVLKWSFMRLFLDPLLPHKPIFALYYPWFHPLSLIYTILYGVKAYCLLGAVNVFMGLEQVIMGWNMVQLFDSPIIASSPRDFWSRRWNRVIRNLLHTQIFLTNKHNTEIAEKEDAYQQDEDKKRAQAKNATKKQEIQKYRLNEPSQVLDHLRSFFSKRHGRGLITFVVSGVFHELIIMSVCRQITFENLMFFTIQGVAVLLEVVLRHGALKQEPEGKTRIICIAAQLLFMACTGRLFLGPYLRYAYYTDK